MCAGVELAKVNGSYKLNFTHLNGSLAAVVCADGEACLGCIRKFSPFEQVSRLLTLQGVYRAGFNCLVYDAVSIYDI